MSLCDWPGRISAVLFFGGCDLRCPTCHNSALAWTPETLPCLVPKNVYQFLEARASWLDGLVVSGGEATLSDDLPLWLAEVRQRVSLPVKLDTNGMHPKVVEESLRHDLVDLVAVDVKGPLAKYPMLTGNRVATAQARACLEQIFDLAKEFPDRFMFRCTLVPQLEPVDVDHVRGLLPAGFSLATQSFYNPPKVKTEEHAC